MKDRVNAALLLEKKRTGKKISVLTAYDFPTAKLVDEAGVDIALVGDSLGMVVLGYKDTLPVTMEDMLRHTGAVVRGVKRAMVVADMPFMSYQVSGDSALINAGRLLQESGADAVKLEGGVVVAETIRRMVVAGIPVMGHLGMTPQSVRKFGGWRLQGRTEADAHRILQDAKALESAGVFAMVLELMPQDLAKRVTESVSIPTIGIGAGPFCDGQVQVVNDILGLYSEFHPKHAKVYVDLSETIRQAFEAYVKDVEDGSFPGPEQSF